MKPQVARWTMVAVVVFTAGYLCHVANSAPFNGEFLPGLMIVVLPVLALSFVLPKIIPVSCPKCNTRMPFRFKRSTEAEWLFGYTCDRCGNDYTWSGASSGSSFDS